MNQQYEIQRVMNNNVVLARSTSRDREVVLMGKGIGFGKRKGQQLDAAETTIEKVFEADDDSSMRDSYLRMLEEVNGDVVEICTEILLVAERKLGNLSDRSFIVVVDHISFAIEKLDKGIKIENPFVYEIERLYPEEFAIGEFARKRILELLEVDITMDEVGFIALHLNAAKENRVVKDTLKDTRIIKSMVDIIEQALEIDLKRHTTQSNRLMNHLRGLLHRISEGKTEPRHPLHDVTIRECAEAYELVQQLAVLLGSEHKPMGDADRFYLTLHLDRLIRSNEVQP